MALDKERDKFRNAPAWQESKIGDTKEVIEQAQKQFIFATLTGMRHRKLRSTQGASYYDAVKDDSRSFAVFTKQGSSASHMTAAKVSDVISRLPDCASEATDAVSANTQAEWRCSKIVKITGTRMPNNIQYKHG